MSQLTENRAIIEALWTAQQEETPVVLATVVKTRGSVPRRSGAKMLVYEDGRFIGTIGGGEMESLVLREAAAALQDGRPRTLPYSLVDPARGDPGVCGGEVELYLEPYLPPTTIMVIGCGHVGRAVADLAHWLGFRVAVTDDREEMVTPEQIPRADLYLPGAIEDVLQTFTVTPYTYIAALTRNVKVDLEILPHLLETPTPYIGIIGSQRRWTETKKLLQDKGINAEQLERIHSPIGLEIKAETPEEIAVSIMAEIIEHYRR